MEDRTPLPTKAELEKLLRKVLPENEEIDALSAGTVRDEQQIGRMWLSEALRFRLERRVAGMRERGEEIPAGLSETLLILQRKAESQVQAELDPDPKTWVDSLLNGRVPSRLPPANQSTPIHAFRSAADETLTEEDLQILQELAKEIETLAKEQDEKDGGLTTP